MMLMLRSSFAFSTFLARTAILYWFWGPFFLSTHLSLLSILVGPLCAGPILVYFGVRSWSGVLPTSCVPFLWGDLFWSLRPVLGSFGVLGILFRLWCCRWVKGSILLRNSLRACWP